MEILVGNDGSDGGADALELARVLGEATGVGVEARAFDGGSPAREINDFAEREEVGTIVVGSPHRGAVGRVLLGSVADGLLHGAPCETLVAPRGYREEEHGPFRTIAVAYDDTPEAKAALKRAEEIALACRATIVLFTVSGPPATVPGPSGYTPAVPPESAAIVTRAVKGVDERLAATGRALSGIPAAEISAACEEAGADLLVVGSRGYGPALRVLLGSVSTQLMHRAPCPVLVTARP